jgi:hypothetical protein
VNLHATIKPALAGDGNDKTRRQELLTAILKRFADERESGVEKVLEAKTTSLEIDFRNILNQLEAKL